MSSVIWADDVKICETCGCQFSRKPKDSTRQWADRAYCSAACSNEAKKDKPPHLRFWDKVEVRDGNACWPWRGTTDDMGYGRISHRTEVKKAHRLSYEMRYGPIPDGIVVCHICDNPNCVNPNHLFAATQRDNVQDAVRKGRLNPRSALNLHPGAPGFRGAGPISNKDANDGQR